MSVPGSNLLDVAFTVIEYQTVTYYKFVSRAANNIGEDVTTYQSPVTLNGSFQPVPRQLYEQYGLDLQREYYTFYTSNNLLDIGRNVSGDQLAFSNTRFQCISNNDWFALDGWKGVLCVAITGGTAGD